MTFVTKSHATDVSLNLRRITQKRGMECWYAAASMVLGYRNPGAAVVAMSSNIQTLTRLYKDKGINADVVTAFAAEVGLSPAIRPPRNEIAWYAHFLRTNGPMWVWISRPGYNHIVVVYGIHGDELALADPLAEFPFPLMVNLKDFERSALSAIPVLFKR